MIAELNHMIDDVAPQDAVMDTFRCNFPLVAGCYVKTDGKAMYYRLKKVKGADMWLTTANNIIHSLDLPLDANIRVKREKGIVVEVFLNLIYKP